MHKKRKKSSSKILTLIYFILFVVIFTLFSEYLLNFYGKTLCPERGCKIVSSLPMVSKNAFLLIGILYFSVLLILTLIYKITLGTFFLNLLILLLTGGFAAEILFLFKQILEYKVICYFCFIILLFFILLLVLYLIYLRGKSFSLISLITSFVGFLLGLGVSFYITTQNYSLPQEQKAYLIYTEDCPVCKEIIKNMDSQVGLIPANKIYPLLKDLNINQVPLLIEKTEKGFFIHTSTEEIKAKLNLKQEPIYNNRGIECAPEKNSTGGLCEIS